MYQYENEVFPPSGSKLDKLNVSSIIGLGGSRQVRRQWPEKGNEEGVAMHSPGARGSSTATSDASVTTY